MIDTAITVFLFILLFRGRMRGKTLFRIVVVIIAANLGLYVFEYWLSPYIVWAFHLA